MWNFVGVGFGDLFDGIWYIVDVVFERLIVELGEEGLRIGFIGFEVEV